MAGLGNQLSAELHASVILVVGPDPGASELVEILRAGGFPAVHRAADPPEALIRSEQVSPEVILLDPGSYEPPAQPAVDPVAALCALVGAGDGPSGEAPDVVVVTGRDLAARRAALEHGASEVLTLPLLPDEVLGRLRVLLRARVLSRWQAGEAEAIERIRAERDRVSGEAQFLRRVLDSVDQGVIACGPDGELRLVNAAATQLGLRPSAATTQPRLVSAVFTPDGSPVPVEEDPLRRAWLGEQVVGQELTLDDPLRGRRSVVMHGRPLLADPGSRLGAVLAVQDVTDRQRIEEELRDRVLHDRTTGLPSQVLFLDRVERALANAERDHRPLAVLSIDVAPPAGPAGWLGTESRDAVLRVLGERLTRALRPGDTAAYVAEQQFAVLCAAPVGESSARRIGARIKAELSRPIEVGGRQLRPRLAIGVDVARGHDLSAQEFVQNAHISVLQAQLSGGARVETYGFAGRHQVLERLDVRAALRHAMNGDELRLYYQPMVDLRTGRLVGAEALVRWHRPGTGLIPAARFLPVAEEVGLIVQLDDWVLERACGQLAVWQHGGVLPEGFRVSVNLSGTRISRPGLADQLAAVLGSARVDPHRFCVEVAEEALARDPDRTAGALASISRLGVGIAVDDVGGGALDTSWLRRFPVASLKLDRRLVGALTDRSGSAGMVSNVIDTGHRLGLVTVAQGVETDRQASALVALGCEWAQGHYFFGAAPAERVTAALRR